MDEADTLNPIPKKKKVVRVFVAKMLGLWGERLHTSLKQVATSPT